MPRLKSLLEYFPQLESIPSEKVMLWLKDQGSRQLLENVMGNIILYPQVIPTTEKEMLLEKALLKEALKLQPQTYYNPRLNKLFIDEALLERFPDTFGVMEAFVDALQPRGLVSLVLRSENIGSRNAGTLLRPQILKPEGEVNIWVGDQRHDIKIGSLKMISCSFNHLTIRFESEVAKIMDHHKMVAEVAGGKLGVVVDTRS